MEIEPLIIQVINSLFTFHFIFPFVSLYTCLALMVQLIDVFLSFGKCGFDPRSQQTYVVKTSMTALLPTTLQQVLMSRVLGGDYFKRISCNIRMASLYTSHISKSCLFKGGRGGGLLSYSRFVCSYKRR